MTGFKICIAAMSDLDDLAVLFDAYRQFYEQPTDIERARRFLKARIMANESVIFLARDVTGAALGFTQLFPVFTSVGTARLWLLNDLYVDAGARRAGVARALMDAAREHAACTNAAGILLETQKNNAPARALYERLGYALNTATDYFFLKT